MLIANGDRIAKLLQRDRPLATAFLIWVETAAAADWSSIQDVRENFPAADGVLISDGTVVTVFNIKGNSYRLLTTINYAVKLITIISVLTRAEYSKNRWK